MIEIGLYWDYNPKKGPFDVDIAAILLDSNGKLTPDECVYYAKPEVQGVRLIKDSQTGMEQGADEALIVNHDSISTNIKEIILVATIKDGRIKQRYLKDLENAKVEILTNRADAEIELNLTEKGGLNTTVEIAKIVFHSRNNYTIERMEHFSQDTLSLLRNKYR